MVFLFHGSGSGPAAILTKKFQISRHFVPRNGGEKRKDKTSRQFLNFYTAAKERILEVKLLYVAKVMESECFGLHSTSPITFIFKLPKKLRIL
jgi:hypothetical protein